MPASRDGPKGTGGPFGVEGKQGRKATENGIKIRRLTDHPPGGVRLAPEAVIC